MIVHDLTQRVRQSLFVIPGIGLIVGGIGGELMVRLDRAGAADWLPDSYETSSDNARAVLGSIATGTITVVTLVLTLTLVTIQLAAGQLSPRTIVNFLGDRFQQATVGVVLATASFSLLALRSVRAATDEEVRQPDLTVLVAVAATLISLTMLVRSVDRTANRLAVGNLLRDVAEETCQLIDRRYGREVAPGVSTEQPGQLVARPGSDSDGTRVEVTATNAGWIQHIDDDALIDALPEGAAIEVMHQVGTFVLNDMTLLRVGGDELGDDQYAALQQSIAIGDQRTMQQDVSYGLTRMTDIGLRALSPGINDPNTAREVVLRMGQVILSLQGHELDPVESEVDGHSVVRHGAPSHDAFVRDAFDQLRHAGADDRAMLTTLARVLQVIRAETERQGLPGSTSELERQHTLVTDRLTELGAGLDEAADSERLSMP